MTSANRLAVLACATLVATTAAGCASAKKVVTGGDDKGAITMGTSSGTSVLDPAARTTPVPGWCSTTPSSRC
ncbi:hypothetical protein ACFQ0T_06300 [Kitasatospora gansuensis]